MDIPANIFTTVNADRLISNTSTDLTAMELWHLENPDKIDGLNSFVSDYFESQLSYIAKTCVEEGTFSSDEYMLLVHFIAERDERLVAAFRSFALFQKLIPFLDTILALAKFGEIPTGDVSEALKPFFIHRDPFIDDVKRKVKSSKKRSR